MITYLTGNKISRRWEMVFFLFSGIVVVYTLRVNMSVAVIPMKDDLNWKPSEKGYVLSAFYWGYAAGQIPSSYLISKYGAKWIFGLSVLIPSLLTLFVPVAAKGNVSYALMIRCILGFFESASFPAVYYFIPIWIPTSEITVLIPTVASGMYLGVIIGFGLSGYLVESSDFYIGEINFGGWPSVFYVFGIVGILWFPLYAYFAYESPHSHPYITQEELSLFQESDTAKLIGSVTTSKLSGSENDYSVNPLGDSVEKVSASSPIEASNLSEDLLTMREPEENFDKDALFFSAPWFQFFTNIVSITFLFANWVYGFIGFSLLSELPSYLNDQLDFTLKSSGLLCILPYMVLFLSTLAYGRLFDYLQSNHNWSKRTIRQLSMWICFGGSSVVLITCGYLDNKFAAYSSIVLVQLMFGAGQSGIGCCYVEVSPKFTSILSTIGNTIGAVAGLVGPLAVEALLEDFSDDNKIQGWRIFFFIVAGMSCLSLCLWGFYQTSSIVPALNTPARYTSRHTPILVPAKEVEPDA